MPKPHESLRRELTLSRDTQHEGVYNLSFSSEDPYARWWGVEILDHSDGAADLSRLSEMGVVLFNHNRDAVIGRVTSVQIANGRGEAQIVFDDDERSTIIKAKVDSGTLKGVSVGYRVDVWERVEAGAKSTDGRFTGPVEIAKSWTPLEISIVSIPADATVGVGRDLEISDNEEEKQMPILHTDTPANEEQQRQDETRTEQTTTEVVATAAPMEPAVSITRTHEDSATIAGLCAEFGLDAETVLRSDATIGDVRSQVIERLRTQQRPVHARVTRDEGDKFRAAAVDALLMRGGMDVENPAEGARDLRGLTLEKLAVRTLADVNVDASMMSREAIFDALMERQYLSPGMAFPSIMDEAIEKSYTTGWERAPATYPIWTARGSLSDFRPSNAQYVAGSAGELLLVPEGGELKHDIPVDHKRPQRQLHTYGRQLTMSRQAFINDDIGLVATLPGRWAMSARTTINKQVYQILVSNPAIYTGLPLFNTGEHKNLMPTGIAPSMDAIRAMVRMMGMQTDPEGNAILMVPRYFITPLGLGDAIRELFDTPAFIEAGNMTMRNNPLHGRGYEVVEDATLNVLGNEIEYYALAHQQINPTIQIDYLNGVESPTIRRTEPVGRLGLVWDVFMDWGISVMDFRSAVKNPGEEE